MDYIYRFECYNAVDPYDHRIAKHLRETAAYMEEQYGYIPRPEGYLDEKRLAACEAAYPAAVRLAKELFCKASILIDQRLGFSSVLLEHIISGASVSKGAKLAALAGLLSRCDQCVLLAEGEHVCIELGFLAFRP